MASATLALVVGLIALAGWSFGMPALTQFFTIRSAMQPTTALCAIVAATSVIAAGQMHRNRLTASVLAAIVLVLSLQTLAQFALGIDFGTDRLLFPTAVDLQPVPYNHPGRMAMPTATAYLLVALGLVGTLAGGRTWERVAAGSATAVLLLVTIALLGHLYTVAPLEGVLGFTQVSIPTSLALGGLSVGILALRPGGGWVRLLVGESLGAVAARWLIPVVVIVPVIVASLALKGSDIGLYPADFRLAFTTAVTIVLLAALALWGAAQLDTLVAERRMAAALRESEATLRAFFETEGLFTSIIERQDGDFRYLTANKAFSQIFGRQDISGAKVRDVEPEHSANATIAQIEKVEQTRMPSSEERCVDAGSGVRWFAVTISPIASASAHAPRFATASLEITERKRAEAQQRLLLDELNHRVKNTLAVVQSLAQQSFKGDLADARAKQAFEARLVAVASAHGLLVRQDWKAASLKELITDVVGPGCGADRDRIDANGPDVELPPNVAVSVALALHELCTNAVKYGSLSNDRGRISIEWRLLGDDPRALQIIWAENGGPPVVAPTGRGFGSKLIERALSLELGRPVKMDFRPEGLCCSIETVLPTG